MASCVGFEYFLYMNTTSITNVKRNKEARTNIQCAQSAEKPVCRSHRYLHRQIEWGLCTITLLMLDMEHWSCYNIWSSNEIHAYEIFDMMIVNAFQVHWNSFYQVCGKGLKHKNAHCLSDYTRVFGSVSRFQNIVSWWDLVYLVWCNHTKFIETKQESDHERQTKAK